MADEESDPILIALSGSDLAVSEAEELRRRIADAPKDLTARLRLLGYLHKRVFQDEAARTEHASHVCWLIDHHPDHEILASPLTGMLGHPPLAVVKEAWDRALSRRRVQPKVIYTAAVFFSGSDREKSTALLHRGAEAEPSWSRWSRALAGRLHHEVTVDRYAEDRQLPRTMTTSRRMELAREALGHFERLMLLAENEDVRFQSLADYAEMAFEAGEHDRARQYAEEILRRARHFTHERHLPDYIHDAHIILGRIAAAAGDLDRASAALLAAGAQGSPAAPVLRSFGPDFHLARVLLARGRKQTVLDYLDLCATFWKRDLVRGWIAALARGEEVRFDPYGDA